MSKQTSSLVDAYSKQKSVPSVIENDEEFMKNGEQKRKSGMQIIEIEKSEVGSVKWNVYTSYLKANGYLLTLMVCLCYAFGNGFQVGANVWLADWSNDAGKYENRTPPNTDERLIGYAGLGFGQGTQKAKCMYYYMVYHRFVVVSTIVLHLFFC